MTSSCFSFTKVQIFCTQRNCRLICPKFFNENSMTTLNNYLEKNNALIFFSYLPSDIFHNTKMTVLKKVSYEEKAMALNLKTETRDDFVNSLRTIYTRSAEMIKQLSKNL